MSDPRPNILIIVCHDLGRFLGCYGVGTARTPCLDELAGGGVRLTRAFCTAPQCSSSRASLYTGRYPHCNGVMGLTHEPFGWDLYPQERHLGQILQAAGYGTALVGIHHESRRLSPERVARRCGMGEIRPPGRAEVVGGEAMALMERFAGRHRPFYLQLGLEETHRIEARQRQERDYMGFIGDYIRPDERLGVSVPGYLRDTPGTRAELAELQGAARHADAAIGAVLYRLRQLGLEENTLVVFTTDHGLALPRAKCTLYDPGIESALLLRLPARGWGSGRSLDALVSNVDVMPTLLELAGIAAPPGLQGRSLVPLLQGRAFEPRDAVFAEMTYHDYYDPQRAIRTGRHKLIAFFSAAPAFMDPSQSWRPRAEPRVPEKPALAYHPTLELYDLEADPWEQHDLARDPACRDIRNGLLARLGGWMQATADPLLEGAVTSPQHRRAVEHLTKATTPSGREG